MNFKNRLYGWIIDTEIELLKYCNIVFVYKYPEQICEC